MSSVATIDRRIAALRARLRDLEQERDAALAREGIQSALFDHLADIDTTPPPARRDAPRTSLRASDALMPVAGTIRRRVIHLVAAMGWDGATDDELERHLAMKHQTVSAARRTLELGGWVRATETTRPTRTGRQATVYIATPAARRALADEKEHVA